MLIDQKVQVKVANKNREYYSNIVQNVKSGEIITVDVHELPKRSTKIVKFKCDFCDKIFEKQLRGVGSLETNFCSKECNKKYQSNLEKERFEQLIGGVDAKEYLYQKYVVDKMTTRNISKEIYGRDTNASSVARWIKALGLENEIRHGSEAIKTQWINNPKRKKEQGELIKKHWGAGTPSRMKLIKKMNTIEYKEKSRVAKLGKNNPMYGVTGENHPHWNPSLTNEERLLKRKIPQNYKWIRDVYERDNYTCQCCGYDNGGTLIAHHLNSWHWDKDNRFNIENGVTLCESCHHRFHKEYGYKDNTKEQFLEYLNKALVK